jgi:hypothetical protein
MTNHCTYEQSQALKEIGFDLPVRDCYDIDHHLCCNNHTWNWNLTPHFTSAPTHAEALEWFREKKGLDGWVEPNYNGNEKGYFIRYVFNLVENFTINEYPTHHEATSALIDKIIEITKIEYGCCYALVPFLRWRGKENIYRQQPY